MIKCVISAYFKFVIRFRIVAAFCLKSTNVLCTIDVGKLVNFYVDFNL